jgi:hypothetical protein
MGILDDAIREHLELKRRHGVPEEELERQEEEALGPARRDVAQQPEEAGEDEPSAHAQETALLDMQGEAEAKGPPVEELVPDEPPASMEPPSAAEPAAEPAEPAEPVAEPAAEPAEPAAEATPVEPPPVEPPPVEDDAEDLGDTQPHGFDALDDDADEPEPIGADPEEEDPDVLEDTPDFLQETPEHDRLWFEQKPPRDFDFD